MTRLHKQILLIGIVLLWLGFKIPHFEAWCVALLVVWLFIEIGRSRRQEQCSQIDTMGIDAIDLGVRLEKAFDFRAGPRGFARLYYSAEQLEDDSLPITDATIGQIHERLCELLLEQGHAAPADSWQRVQKCVAECLAVPLRVRKESRFVADLGGT